MYLYKSQIEIFRNRSEQFVINHFPIPASENLLNTLNGISTTVAIKSKWHLSGQKQYTRQRCRCLISAYLSVHNHTGILQEQSQLRQDPLTLPVLWLFVKRMVLRLHHEL